jgi:two-component system, NtrC family, nitrogen regulation response regulator NtrX
MAADILIVDDEADIRELIAGILQDEGFETRLAHNSDAALSELTQRRPSLVVLDIWLQGSRMDGLDLLLEIKARAPDVPVVIISGHGNIETAVSAIRRGAYDYIEKPFNADRLLLVVGRALETTRLKRENDELKGKSGLAPELVGNSLTIRNLRQLLKKIAPSNSRVLVSGPMGSGKELVARTIHANSTRASGPFVTLAGEPLRR